MSPGTAQQAKVIMQSQKTVSDAVYAAAADPSNTLTAEQAQQVIPAISAQITPVLVHATSSEPWYQSRVTIGNYVALASAVIGPMIGTTLQPDDQALITGLITGIGVAAGAAFSLYGRWKAKKPLGS